MREIFSFLYQLLSSPLGLPIPPFWEYIILLVIEVLAFRIAWNISPGGVGGSVIHWVIRIVTLFTIWAVTYGIIWVVRALVRHWVIFLSVFGGVVLLSGVIAAVYFHRKKRQNKCRK